MVETRIAPRYRVNKPATVEYRGTKHVCTVRDLSISGAALQFSVLIRSLCGFRFIPAGYSDLKPAIVPI